MIGDLAQEANLVGGEGLLGAGIGQRPEAHELALRAQRQHQLRVQVAHRASQDLELGERALVVRLLDLHGELLVEQGIRLLQRVDPDGVANQADARARWQPDAAGLLEAQVRVVAEEDRRRAQPLGPFERGEQVLEQLVQREGVREPLAERPQAAL